MVKRILTFFNKEFNGVNEAALLLGGFAFLSQLLGMVRDRTLAHVVGAGPVLDVYYAAFRIPDFLYISIASLASVTVLMPFLIDKINNGPQKADDARRFLNSIFSAYMLFMVGVSIVVALFMPHIARWIAPGFTEAQLDSLVMISRIMLLSPIFIGLSNLIGTITQLFRNFFVFSLSPVFYNIGILFGIVYLYPRVGIAGLGWGVITGAILHLAIQIPTVIKHRFFPTFSRITWSEVRSVVSTSLPRTFTLSSNSLAFIVLIAMASTLVPGSISLFTFSYNLQSVPVGIIGISYSVAAFPLLVQSFSKKDMGNFIGHIIGAAKQIVFWSLPAMALLVVLRAQIVRVVLGSNAFSWSDTRLTAAAAALFIVSLVSQGLVLLFVRGYYATGNTKKPLIVNVSSSILVIILASVFVFLFRHYPMMLSLMEGLLRVKDVPGTIMLALPLAYASGSLINFFLIWVLFKKDFIRGVHSGLSVTFVQSALGAVAMGSVAYICLDLFDDVFMLSTGWGVFLQGFFSGVIGIAFGVVVLTLLGSRELATLLQTLTKKLWRKQTIAPEQKEL
ncbi:MAG: lipid II flippase MurJ [Patescibacteria group bacterium]